MKSPQEKKAASYARDRRNAYGENDKASRKTIPARKAEENQRVRRETSRMLDDLVGSPDADADLMESSLRHDVARVGGWRKFPDVPLGAVLARKSRKMID